MKNNDDDWIENRILFFLARNGLPKMHTIAAKQLAQGTIELQLGDWLSFVGRPVTVTKRIDSCTVVGTRGLWSKTPSFENGVSFNEMTEVYHDEACGRKETFELLKIRHGQTVSLCWFPAGVEFFSFYNTLQRLARMMRKD